MPTFQLLPRGRAEKPCFPGGWDGVWGWGRGVFQKDVPCLEPDLEGTEGGRDTAGLGKV